MKTSYTLTILIIICSALAFLGCQPLLCPKCESDNLVEIRNEPDKLKCDDCGNITYKK